MSNWRKIGAVELVQIQSGVMTGKGGYDTALLHRVERLRLTREGVSGLFDGAWVVDRHHLDHPEAKYWHAEDVLSFGFTSHYEHMWRSFRPTPLGGAGENLIVTAPNIYSLDDIAGGLRVVGTDGPIDFENPKVAEPCVEFTRFMTDRPDATARDLKADREKLRGGVRGFVVGVSGSEPREVAPGDEVWARSG